MGPMVSLAPGNSYKNALLGGGATQQSNAAPLMIKDSVSMLKNPTRYVRPLKMLTVEKKAEHLAKNLCFYCHKQFSRDHRCP